MENITGIQRKTDNMNRREIIQRLSAMPMAGAYLSIDPLFATSHSDRIVPAENSESPGGPLKPGSDIYQSIGVEPVINCRGTITAIGGSLELPEVVKAMESASRHFVQLDELAMAVGSRLAQITGAEWGMVSAGCAAGMKHVTTACITDGDPEKLIRIPNLEGFQKTEVISPRYSRNEYDHSIRNAGVKIITVDTAEELQNAINSRTALIYLLSAHPSYDKGPLSVENIAGLASAAKIPILVDAAAEILTIPNVHLQRGATIVAYSGGKAIRGPQCAGVLLGKKYILMAAWQASAPHHGPGRDNKVGKEEHIGMLAAIEAWIKRDHAKEEKAWVNWLSNISDRISGIKSLTTEIKEPSGLDNRSALMTISWDPGILNITSEEVAEDLAKNKPRIALGCRSDLIKGTTSLSLSAWTMKPGEDKIVADRLFQILNASHPEKSSDAEEPSVNLTGHWDIDVDYYTGKNKHRLFIENQDGNWIHGSYMSTFSLQDIYGKIEGNTVKLLSI
jgi:uncharacterized pyridoxal phosphate-dependent enzyme